MLKISYRGSVVLLLTSDLGGPVSILGSEYLLFVVYKLSLGQVLFRVYLF